MEVTDRTAAEPGIVGQVNIRQVGFGREEVVGHQRDAVVLQVEGLEAAGGDTLQEARRQRGKLVLRQVNDLQKPKLTEGAVVKGTNLVPVQKDLHQTGSAAEHQSSQTS